MSRNVVFISHQTRIQIENGISIPRAALKAVRGQPEAAHSFGKGVQVYREEMKGQDGIENGGRKYTVLYETFLRAQNSRENI
jgi:hypothetical protein